MLFFLRFVMVMAPLHGNKTLTEIPLLCGSRIVRWGSRCIYPLSHLNELDFMFYSYLLSFSPMTVYKFNPTLVIPFIKWGDRLHPADEACWRLKKTFRKTSFWHPCPTLVMLYCYFTFTLLWFSILFVQIFFGITFFSYWLIISKFI